MIASRVRWSAAAILALVAVALAPATASAATGTPFRPGSATVAGVPAAPSELPEPPPLAVARAELVDLAVEPPHSMAGYSRALFPHWTHQTGTCDTREVVLVRDGVDVSTDRQCRSVSGMWISPFDGVVLTDAARVDIDHIVPMANAWRSGADTWTTARRREFANDLTDPQLLATSARSNRSKGDQSPDQWKPPLTSYWCTYARAWTRVKFVYQLAVTGPEQEALTSMLDTCA